MNKKPLIKLMATSLIASAFFVGCGSSSNGNSNGASSNNENQMANIPYLRENHANYVAHGSQATPAPTKDASKKSIDWIISATSTEGATKLAEHINIMTGKLKAADTPRAFDKVFIMESYMKLNSFYTTAVERDGTTVVISKNATTDCAYKVISAHSDIVGGDFFAQGIINIDHSAEGEQILASSACDSVRADLTKYIAEKHRTGMGMN